jgi:conserved domain protein
MDKIDLNMAVITTRFVLENKTPILHVFHYEDGFWQFSGAEINLMDEDYKIVSLEEIIKIDRSIQNILDLSLGEEAYRKNIEEPWNRIK